MSNAGGLVDMSNFKWLQVSDLHFTIKDSFDMSFARKALLKCLATESIKPNYIFITGDIADKNDYSASKMYIEELLKTVGFIDSKDKEKVFWSVGNHDIKRGFEHREQIITKIRETKNHSKEFESSMADDEKHAILTHIGMSSYIKECENILDRKLNSDEILDAHHYTEFDDFNLVVLNTCLTSCDDDDHYKLMIIEKRLYNLFDRIKNKDKPIIVIGHHGKMFFHMFEQDKLAHLFEEVGVDLYLCGHSHRLGYDRFDYTGRDIPQITCGGGRIEDGYSVFSFMVGEYNSLECTVTITPYSYRESREFKKDYNLCRRLSSFNNTFTLDRLIALRSNYGNLKQEFYNEESFLEDADLFARSQSHYEFMHSEQGRFSFLQIDEDIFANVKAKGSDDNTPLKMLEILCNPKTDILVIGDGGMGKTTSLLHVWEIHLKNKARLPLYIPLNDYRQQKDFICDYIKRYYGSIDLSQLKRDFLLLLDGFNEISGETHHLIAELKDLLLKHGEGRMRVVITSRHDFIQDYRLDSFQPYQILPLDKYVIRKVVRKHVSAKNLPFVDAATDVLKTPMMLSLYTETCNVQLHSSVKDLFIFKENKRRGEILYNFLLCQVAKLVISGRLEEVAPTWRALFSIAPYIAYEMESNGIFHISKEKFDQLEAAYSEKSIGNNRIPQMPNPLQKMLYGSGALTSYSENAENILLYRQYLLVEKNKQYSFRHQYFRDFFAAIHIATNIENYIKTKRFAFSPVLSDKLWSIYVREMLGDYYGDYKNKEAYQYHTPLHVLLGRLRNRSNVENGLAINNVLETWRKCRGNRIVGENLSNLDLSRISLNGVVFYTQGYATNFDGSKISDITLLAQGHSSCIESAIYSPDGKKILSASWDNTVKEWSRETGECLHTFEGHSSSVSSISYSTSGQNILSASWDSTIREWDQETGKCLRAFEGHLKRVESVVYSPGGQNILSASFDRTIKEWDRETGECLRTFEGHLNRVESAIYSPDGKKILSASWDRTIKEWDRETGECLRTFEGHLNRVESVIYSPDGQNILSASFDRTIKEWDRETGKCLHTFEGHSGSVNSAIYSLNSKKILSTFGDGTIKELDQETGRCLRIFVGHLSSANSAIYSADGNRILSASFDRTIKEWDQETGKCLRTFEGSSSRVASATYNPDGQKILSASVDSSIKEWDRKTGECLHTFVGHLNRVANVIYSPDGQRILSASWDNTIKEWDKETEECLLTFEGHSDRVESAVYSPDGQRILSASWDNTIKEWDQKTGECLRTFVGHSDRVESAIYSPDYQKILSASLDKTIKEWDRESGECLFTFDGHSDRVESAIYSPDGQRILSASGDNSIKEWDRETGASLRTFEGHSNRVESAVYSPDYQRILSASFDRTIKEWDRETGRCLRTFGGHLNRVESAVYSSDGQKILSASLDSTIKEWDRETGECELTIRSHDGIHIMNCSFKGCQFTTTEIERIVRIYGGKVFVATIRSIFANNLHKQKRDINIALGGENPVNLVVTGSNSSGKTSLVDGIVKTLKALFGDGLPSEVSVSFSEDNPKEAEEILKLMYKNGNYRFVHFDNTRTHDSSFFDKMDKAGNDADRWKTKNNYEKANELNAWIERTKEILRKLFNDESLRFSFEKEKPGDIDRKYKIYYTLGDKEIQLKRGKLPDGFSSVLEIYSTILDHFNDDITISPCHYKGLVVIDELESHLHVSLKKRIFPCLIELFPGIQFIITTHSPFIINSANNSIVYELKS